MVHRIYIIDERISYVKRLALQSQRGNVSQSYGQNRHWQILCISILYRGEQWNHKTLEWSSRICSAIKRRHSHVYYRYFGSSAICQIWYLGKKVRYFPKGILPSGNFPNVQFSKRPLPSPLAAALMSPAPQTTQSKLWKVASWEIAHLGSFTFGKRNLGNSSTQKTIVLIVFVSFLNCFKMLEVSLKVLKINQTV